MSATLRVLIFCLLASAAEAGDGSVFIPPPDSPRVEPRATTFKAIELPQWSSIIKEVSSRAWLSFGLVARTPEAINLLVNHSFVYVEEPPHTNIWLSPSRFLSARGGDCEEFATAKFFLLERLGLKPQLVLLPHHMVVTVNGLILDNKTDSILSFDSILPDILAMLDRSTGTLYPDNSPEFSSTSIEGLQPEYFPLRVCTSMPTCSGWPLNHPR